jgi:prepilin-type N-terminal cleavage/methylation domain-containing protein
LYRGANVMTRGFTLLEMVVVLALIGLLATFTFPRLAALGPADFPRQTRELSGLLRRVQGRCLAERALLRVRYLPTEDRLQAEEYIGGEFRPLPGASFRFGFSRNFQLIEARQDKRLLERDWMLHHWPDGHRETVVLLIRDGRERLHRITVPAFFGPLQLQTVHVAPS